jgi:phage repressor protein C with HTH and peptisase S24 domain
VHMERRFDYGALVRAIQKKTGENQTQLAGRFKVSQPTVSRWIAGNDPELDHAERIEAEARRLRVVNPKSAINVTTVNLVGYVGAGGTIAYQDGQGPFGEAEMPPGAIGTNIVAVKVQGDSMSGVLDDGSIVYYDNRQEPPDERLYRKLCIVGLADGRVLIKRLFPGRIPDHYDLHSTNGPVMLDEKVVWAARVSWIAPA